METAQAHTLLALSLHNIAPPPPPPPAPPLSLCLSLPLSCERGDSYCVISYTSVKRPLVFLIKDSALGAGCGSVGGGLVLKM